MGMKTYVFLPCVSTLCWFLNIVLSSLISHFNTFYSSHPTISVEMSFYSRTIRLFNFFCLTLSRLLDNKAVYVECFIGELSPVLETKHQLDPFVDENLCNVMFSESLQIICLRHSSHPKEVAMRYNTFSTYLS